VLELDLLAPGEGWAAYLDSCSIPVVKDDLGRLATSRADARRLFAEGREVEARLANRDVAS
jgi:hypothetical protein